MRACHRCQGLGSQPSLDGDRHADTCYHCRVLGTPGFCNCTDEEIAAEEAADAAFFAEAARAERASYDCGEDYEGDEELAALPLPSPAPASTDDCPF